MGSRTSILIAQFSWYKIFNKSEQAIFSMLSILKTLNLSLVAEALTGLICHRPPGENSSFACNQDSAQLVGGKEQVFE